MLQTEYEGEVLTHRFLWQAANEMCDRVDGYDSTEVEASEAARVPGNQQRSAPLRHDGDAVVGRNG